MQGLDQYRITNQSDAIKNTAAAMKKKKYRQTMTHIDPLENGTLTYMNWISNETGEGVLTIISHMGDVFVYRLNKVKLEDL